MIYMMKFEKKLLYTKDKNGKLLSIRKTANRWAEYTTELNNDDREETLSFEVANGRRKKLKKE